MAKRKTAKEQYKKAKSLQKSKWYSIFGTPEKAAQAVYTISECCGDLECHPDECPIWDMCTHSQKFCKKYLESEA